MKKSILILIAVLLSCMGAIKSFGQSNDAGSFAPVGAEWWGNGEDDTNGPGGAMVLQPIHSLVLKDTVIMGQACRKIISYKYKEDSYHPLHASDTYVLRTFYVYSTQDTVFVFNQNFNRFTPLYVYNVNVGDTVCLPVIGNDLRPNPIAHGDTCFCFVIDSVKMVRYDTANLKTYFEHILIGMDADTFPNQMFVQYPIPVYNWGYGISYPSFDTSGYEPSFNTTGSYTRITGGNWGGLLPHHVVYAVSIPDGPLYWMPFTTIRCYHDSNYAIQIDSNCFGITRYSPFGITPLEANGNSLTVYPNPTDGLVFLKSEKPFPQGTSVALWDNFGRKIREWSLPAGNTSVQYELKGLPDGIYCLQITAGKTTVVKKIALIN